VAAQIQATRVALEQSQPDGDKMCHAETLGQQIDAMKTAFAHGK
jgi:hypothetical protein